MPRASRYSRQHPPCLPSHHPIEHPKSFPPISSVPRTQCHLLGDSPLKHTAHPWPEPRRFNPKTHEGKLRQHPSEQRGCLAVLGVCRNGSSVPRGDPSSDRVPAHVTPSSIAPHQGRMEKSPWGNHARPRDAGAELRCQAVITEYLLPTVPELRETEGQMPHSSSSARLQGFPSSPLFQTPLPSPVSGQGCSAKRCQRGSAQGKARSRFF